MLYDAIPYDLIHGQGHGGLKVVKMADFKVCLFRQYAGNQKTMVNYETISKFVCIDFLSLFSFGLM